MSNDLAKVNAKLRAARAATGLYVRFWPTVNGTHCLAIYDDGGEGYQGCIDVRSDVATPDMKYACRRERVALDAFAVAFNHHNPTAT